jgi:hypothetical protein
MRGAAASPTHTTYLTSNDGVLCVLERAAVGILHCVSLLEALCVRGGCCCIEARRWEIQINVRGLFVRHCGEIRLLFVRERGNGIGEGG